mmetsp:Transcript_67073/g.189647  ORF Transcript_67073/g.189647 Transcript_67073/m.189647 type:complete len:149 (-) Transcript_67073:86-532(-)
MAPAVRKVVVDGFFTPCIEDDMEWVETLQELQGRRRAMTKRSIEVHGRELRKVQDVQEKVDFSVTCTVIVGRGASRDTRYRLLIYYEPREELKVLSALGAVGVNLKACEPKAVELESPIQEEQDIMLIPQPLFIDMEESTTLASLVQR